MQFMVTWWIACVALGEFSVSYNISNIAATTTVVLASGIATTGVSSTASRVPTSVTAVNGNVPSVTTSVVIGNGGVREDKVLQVL